MFLYRNRDGLFLSEQIFVASCKINDIKWCLVQRFRTIKKFDICLPREVILQNYLVFKLYCTVTHFEDKNSFKQVRPCVRMISLRCNEHISNFTSQFRNNTMNNYSTHTVPFIRENNWCQTDLPVQTISSRVVGLSQS